MPFTGPDCDSRVVPWVAGDLGTSLGVATGAALAYPAGGIGSRLRVHFRRRHQPIAATSTKASIWRPIWRLPIVYVCQNNGWAISQRAAHLSGGARWPPGGRLWHSRRRASTAWMSRRCACCRGQPWHARARRRPTLIEARTWRWRGHNCGDKAAYRTPEEPTGEDPLELYAARLAQRGEAPRSAAPGHPCRGRRGGGRGRARPERA